MKILEWIASLAECYIVVHFLDRWLLFKRENYKYCSIIFLILLAADNIIFSQKEGFENISILFLLVLEFVYSFFLQKGQIYEKILAVLIPMLIMIPINGITLYTLSFAFHESLSELRSSEGDLRILVLFFSKFAFFLISEILIKIKKKDFHMLLSFQWILQILCFLFSFFIANIIWNISRQAEIHGYSILIAYLMIAGLNILLFILLDRMENENRLKEENKLAQVNLESQKNYILSAQKRYQDAKIMHHDMKHYLTTVAGLLSEGKNDDAKSYLENILQKKVTVENGGIHTGYLAIDAVLNEKITACREKGISLKSIINTDFDKINEMDLGILLSNLLDNAACGCEGSENPLIDLSVMREKSYVVITVKNSIMKSVLASNPELHTTKSNKSLHGYGIASIKNITDTYHGKVNFYEKGNLFVSEVWLQVKTSE